MDYSNTPYFGSFTSKQYNIHTVHILNKTELYQMI